jgi:hypothetical protein
MMIPKTLRVADLRRIPPGRAIALRRMQRWICSRKKRRQLDQQSPEARTTRAPVG